MNNSAVRSEVHVLSGWAGVGIDRRMASKERRTNLSGMGHEQQSLELGLSVRFFPVLDTENEDDLPSVINFKKDAISSGSYSVAFGIGELLYTKWSWIGGKGFDVPGNHEHFLIRQKVKVFLRGGLNDYSVSHVSSDTQSETCLFPLLPLPPPSRTCLLLIQPVLQTQGSCAIIPNLLSVSVCLLCSSANAIFPLLSSLHLHMNHREQLNSPARPNQDFDSEVKGLIYES